MFKTVGGALGTALGGPVGGVIGTIGGGLLERAFGGSSSDTQATQQPQEQEVEQLPWDDAYQRAQQALDPGFQRTMDQTLSNIDHQSMQRGFFGQLPAAALRRSTAGDLSMQHQANLAQYATGLQQQDFQRQSALADRALRAQDMDAQRSGQMWQGIGQAVGTAAPYAIDYFSEHGWPWQS